MKLRTAYNFDRDESSLMTGLECTDPSRTQQGQKEEADIMTIVRRFNVTGLAPTNVRPPMYGDFTEVIDFQSAHNAIIQAQESFMKMTAEVRNRFGNDPQQFLEFCEKKENLEEMRKMGLAVPLPVEDNKATGTAS